MRSIIPRIFIALAVMSGGCAMRDLQSGSSPEPQASYPPFGFIFDAHARPTGQSVTFTAKPAEAKDWFKIEPPDAAHVEGNTIVFDQPGWVLIKSKGADEARMAMLASIDPSLVEYSTGFSVSVSGSPRSLDKKIIRSLAELEAILSTLDVDSPSSRKSILDSMASYDFANRDIFCSLDAKVWFDSPPVLARVLERDGKSVYQIVCPIAFPPNGGISGIVDETMYFVKIPKVREDTIIERHTHVGVY